MGQRLEERCLMNEGAECRVNVAQNDDTPRKVEGYAAVFNSESEQLGWGFREIVMPGAFKKTLQEQEIFALHEHNAERVFAATGNGTLRLEEDAHGLRVSADPIGAQWAQDMVMSIDRGDISKMSFGFRAVRDDFRTVDGKEIRELHEVELLDVSAVVYPAYPQSEVQIRSKLDRIELLTDRNRMAVCAGEFLEQLAPEPAPTSADVTRAMGHRRRSLMLSELAGS